jgi:hypothetical protein
VVNAYELQTHAKLSREALATTILITDARLLDALGLRSATDSTQQFPNEIGQQGTVHDLIVQGSVLEDNPLANALARACGYAIISSTPST